MFLFRSEIHLIENGRDPKNGSDVIQTIIKLGRYPSDIQGINVTIDENANSEGTSMLLAMVYNDKCGSKFMKVGDFVSEKNPEIPVSSCSIRKIMYMVFMKYACCNISFLISSVLT